MAMQKEDIAKLNEAKRLVLEVKQNIDCEYCQSHMDIIANMIDDAIDITKFNLLYSNDPDALQNLRKMLTEESTLRLLAIASKVVGFFRYIKNKTSVKKFK